jgi:hypothetical protein
MPHRVVSWDIMNHFPTNLNYFPWCEQLEFDTPYQTVNFFSRVLFNNSTVNTIRGLRALVKQSQKPPVFFLDEVPRIDNDCNRFVVFSRDLLRISGIIPVLLGTDSSAVNMISIAKHSSEAEFSFVWARVITTFPSFLPPSDVSGEMNKLLADGNSRLNNLFLAAYFVDDLANANSRQSSSKRNYDDECQSCVSKLVISPFADLSSQSLEQQHHHHQSSTPVPPRERTIDVCIKGNKVCLLDGKTPFDPVAVYRPTESSIVSILSWT